MIALALVAHVALGVIAVDQSGVTINGANATTCVTPAKTTTSASELVVVMMTGEALGTNPTITDTAGLTWTRLGVFSGTSGGNAFSHALFYASTSGILTTWTATVTTASQGLACMVVTFTGAGTPLNFTTTGTAAPSAETCTITAGSGSFLVAMGSDDTTGGTLTAAAGTTVVSQNFGAASDLFYGIRSTSTVSGSSSVGFTASGDTYSMSCAEIPTGGGGGSGATLHTLTTLGVGN